MKLLIPTLALAFLIGAPVQTFAKDHKHKHKSHHHRVVRHHSHHHHNHHRGHWVNGVWVWYDDYNYYPRTQRDVSVTVPGVGTYRETRW